MPVTSDFQASGITLEAQLVELAAKNPKVGWLLDEYSSIEKHANIALKYVLQHAPQCGYIFPQAVKLQAQPTAFMNAYTSSDSTGMPFIYVNVGLRFFLFMLNYSVVCATFKDTILGGRSMSATLFAIVNGCWPQGVDLVSQTEAMEGFSQDERYFITAWLPSQMLFIIAHEFAHHLIWFNQRGSPQMHKVRLLTGGEIDVYHPSQNDDLRADKIAFDIWNELDSTLSDGFQAFTAGGLGALFGYFRILEKYIQSEPISSNLQLPSVYRYERLKAWLSDSGRVHSLEAMEEAWAVTEILQAKGLEDITTMVAKGADASNKCS